MLPRARDLLLVPPPRHAKIERAGGLIRESSSVFLCSLIEERTIYSSLHQINC
jgi:hypothetical protein